MTCPRSHQDVDPGQLQSLPTKPCSPSPLRSGCGLVEVWRSGRCLSSPSVTSAPTGQNTAAGPDGGRDGCGAPAPSPGRDCHSPELPWAGWAGRGCPVTRCLLPTECFGCLGDHLAAAGPGRAMAGRGWGRAQGHGRLSRPAGHLCLCQGLGAEATGEEPGTPVPTLRHDRIGPSASVLPVWALIPSRHLQLDAHLGKASGRGRQGP